MEAVINRLQRIKYLAVSQRTKKNFYQIIPEGLIQRMVGEDESKLSLAELKENLNMVIDYMISMQSEIMHLVDGNFIISIGDDEVMKSNGR